MIKTWQERCSTRISERPPANFQREMQDEIDELRAKLATLETLYVSSLADAIQWQLYKTRKDAVISAGMGRKAMRDSAPKEAKNE